VALTDIEVRAAKAGDKPYKLGDEHGLYLLVKPNGSKLWKLKYRFLEKEKKLSFGAYPALTLAPMYGRERRVLLRHYLEQGLSKTEIARSLQVSRRTVYQWIDTGQLDRELDNGPARYTPRPCCVAQDRPIPADHCGSIGRVSEAQRDAATRGDPLGRIHRRLHAGKGLCARSATRAAGGSGGAL
jgi:hypothetical protein